MKKLFFSSMLFFSGIIIMLAIYITSIFDQWNYDGIEGFWGFVLGTNSLFLLLISSVFIIFGFYTSYKEAYKNK